MARPKTSKVTYVPQFNLDFAGTTFVASPAKVLLEKTPQKTRHNSEGELYYCRAVIDGVTCPRNYTGPFSRKQHLMDHLGTHYRSVESVYFKFALLSMMLSCSSTLYLDSVGLSGQGPQQKGAFRHPWQDCSIFRSNKSLQEVSTLRSRSGTQSIDSTPRFLQIWPLLRASGAL